MDEEELKRSNENKLLLLRTRAIDAWELASLIELSRDEDTGVRDWATFTLAARDDDTAEARQALLDRSVDPDFDTRSEAIWGLARRRDGRALPLLLEALCGEQIGELFIEAAGFLARPELVETLEELQQWWDLDPALLSEALARCRGERCQGPRIWDIMPANDRTA
ncbi:MAG: HEAT repeat domain-containing protein [Allosphingosinicella sp.]